ncbi:MAG: integrase, partial [Burkholderiaceae bacterium]|nr:integrase [Burkholderiaceae bacterium]
RAILIRARDEWEWIEKAPKVRLFKETNNRERSLTPEQAKLLLSELPEHQREMVLFALATGLRQGNIVRLEWPQVNLELRHAWVQATHSKNRRPISVPLNEIAMGVLKRQQGKHPSRVFTYKGKPIAWAHTWATWQRQAGTPTHELQRLGGWRTGAMVERYAHLASDHLAQAASRLDGVLGGYDMATSENRRGYAINVTP